MQEHATTSPVRAILQVTRIQEHDTMTLVYATPWVTCMQEHDTMTPVHATPPTTCMKEHNTRGTHTRLIKPKVRPWWASPKPRTNASLVDSPKARQTQGPPFASFNGSQNPRPILGKDRHSSAGFSKPKANTSSVQGSLNPRKLKANTSVC